MQGTVDPAIYQAGVSNTLLAAGLALFSIGQAGNLYHHILLARLRGAKAEGDTSSIDPATRKRSYQLPTGGLFDLVTMPHYLFEIIAWVGLSLCTQQLNVILVAAGMSSYLSGRAAATTEWYRQKFPKAVRLTINDSTVPGQPYARQWPGDRVGTMRYACCISPCMYRL